MSPDVEYVEVQLELGHHAYPKPKIGTDGHTHDWMVFVRGPDDCKIHEFIDKVVFNLHTTFPKPRRSFREPPYQVKESGYAGFELPIEIYFKNKEEPKKITYEYDLYLHTNDSVINTRREKLTFQNPSAEFKKKLLKAGGKCHPDPMAKDCSLKPYSSKAKGKSVSSPRTPSHMSSSPAPPESKPKVNGSNGKIHHHRVPGKDISSTNSSSSSTTGPSSSSSSSSSSKLNKEKTVKASAKPDQQFTDLFGPPIQTRPSPDSIPSKAKVKDKEKSKKQKSFHPEKSHSSERSNSRNSNSSTSNSSSTNISTTTATATTSTSSSTTTSTTTATTTSSNSKDNSNNNTTTSSNNSKDINSSSNNNNSNSSSNSLGNEKIVKRSSSSSFSNTSSSLTPSSFRHSAQLSEDYLQQLYWIQKRISELEDPNILQKLVDIIEHNSSCFNITSSTFDFDLLRLDESTVSKLKEVIQGT